MGATVGFVSAGCKPSQSTKIIIWRVRGINCRVCTRRLQARTFKKTDSGSSAWDKLWGLHTASTSPPRIVYFVVYCVGTTAGSVSIGRKLAHFKQMQVLYGEETNVGFASGGCAPAESKKMVGSLLRRTRQSLAFIGSVCVYMCMLINASLLPLHC